jgi:hypothetical protein
MRKNPATSIGDQLFKFKETLEKRKKYVKNEFQAYGLDLAKELGDWKNKSLYLRLAKTVDRQLLEQARYFVKDQNPGAIKTPYKLFMWKLRQLRESKI